jgi:hypothetical protein
MHRQTTRHRAAISRVPAGNGIAFNGDDVLGASISSAAKVAGAWPNSMIVDHRDCRHRATCLEIEIEQKFCP